MRATITFILVLLLTFLTSACTPEIKVPIPPELSAAVLIAMAGNDDECPPEEHIDLLLTPQDGETQVDTDEDGVTDVEWFDPLAIHGDITVFCPESCTIRMTLANGFKWRWLIPGTADRVKEFIFAGELQVPASDHANFEISVGGPLKAPIETFVEVSEGNMFRMVFVDGTDVFTDIFQKLFFPPDQVGEWTMLHILRLKEVEPTE